MGENRTPEGIKTARDIDITCGNPATGGPYVNYPRAHFSFQQSVKQSLLIARRLVYTCMCYIWLLRPVSMTNPLTQQLQLILNSQ